MSTDLIKQCLSRCCFPPPGTDYPIALSGGADSTALVALAVHHGCVVSAHHVDHGLRPSSGDEARHAHRIADALGVPITIYRAKLEPGPNLEARARDARQELLPAGAATGHTADDQAETILLRLLRGAGPTGLAAMEPGPRHPILRLRRADTVAVCAALGITPITDPSNDDPAMWRNRVRHELLPLAADIAGRDLVPILARTAELIRADSAILDELATQIDPTDARQLATADPALARRALRRWLTEDGYPPDAASIDRVLDVAHGQAVACELPGGRRVQRSSQRLHIAPGAR
ncbi:MAG: tRNA lysidine(34) synthetase TilS [Ilumatobacter coccineus]|uniref:tRNA(Ile)-lysidine synthase n=1 Tax=Ilumatobacter coccineus TaxID=467094 RepID=A0A2G6K6B8_9ACTN|nr:MAG: tRNA lysidine(34) synthetase TilS [Ilumatobacter coccineus]